MRTDQGKYEWMGFNGRDFPAMPELENGRTLTFAHKLLRRSYKKTSFSVSTDPIRPAMNGVLFQFYPHNIRAVASDGHRLVKFTMEDVESGVDNVSKNGTSLDLIVPIKALNLASKVDVKDTQICTLTVDDKHMRFDLGVTKIIANRINADFPNYEAVIPLDNDRVVEINRMVLFSAVRRVGFYSSLSSRQIKFKLLKDKLEVQAQDVERASEAVEILDCDFKSEPMMIGFNATYLEELLKNLESEDIRMAFGTPNRAGLISPVQPPDGEQMLVLIMPVMLNTYA